MGIDPSAACNCGARVKSVQNWHQINQGWSDIAYSYVVCPHGNIYEGRGMSWDEFAAKGNGGQWYSVLFLVGGKHVNVETDLYVEDYAGGKWYLTWYEKVPTGAYVTWLKFVRLYADRGLSGPELTYHNATARKSCPGPQLQYYALAGLPEMEQPSDILEDTMQYIIRSEEGPAFWAENGAPVGQDFGFWKDEDSVKVVTVPHEVWQRRLAGYETHKHLAGDIANRVVNAMPPEARADAVALEVVKAIREVWAAP